jgi:uncharacterized protein (TIGR02147 family)
MSKYSSESLFSMNDYRDFVRAWVQSRGRGEYRRIAESLNMHTTLVSQVFKGHKSLTEEQASKLCSYMTLNAMETDYFLKLVQIERAGSERLRETFKRHLQQLRKQANEIRHRVPESKELSEQDRAIFYSSWQHSLVRLCTSIDGLQTAEKISHRLEISLPRVQQILDFLTSRGLCDYKNGQYVRTTHNTHVEAHSPLSIRHHQNWRSKSLDLLDHTAADDLIFTAPVSLSRRDFMKVRSILLTAISELSKVVEDSPSEELAFVGIDWIGIA